MTEKKRLTKRVSGLILILVGVVLLVFLAFSLELWTTFALIAIELLVLTAIDIGFQYLRAARSEENKDDKKHNKKKSCWQYLMAILGLLVTVAVWACAVGISSISIHYSIMMFLLGLISLSVAVNMNIDAGNRMPVP
ncbi:MAG TPA: hypothetical protein PLI45_04345 [Candidatus Woesebacteria bacterium]|nr:hypothetical protein [Candidatus Woesebacteria bacterium]